MVKLLEQYCLAAFRFLLFLYMMCWFVALCCCLILWWRIFTVILCVNCWENTTVTHSEYLNDVSTCVWLLFIFLYRVHSQFHFCKGTYALCWRLHVAAGCVISACLLLEILCTQRLTRCCLFWELLLNLSLTTSLWFTWWGLVFHYETSWKSWYRVHGQCLEKKQSVLKKSSSSSWVSLFYTCRYAIQEERN